jgi:uncharacterized protein YgbK (DUF1537 family)
MAQPGPKCLIVADDLTGACDSAVHFAAAGARAVVAITAEAAEEAADVLAFSTESRDLDPAEARSRIASAAAFLQPLGAALVFKKIDSTLRGNSYEEIVAALDAFACEVALVNPAFPAQGRVVRNGVLRVTGDSGLPRVKIAAALQARGAHPCGHIVPGAIAEAVAAGMRFLCLDAVCEADLSRIAAEGLALERRVLWAGSAGLAAALAGGLWPGAPTDLPDAPACPVLFCLGSEHPVTVKQQARLLAGAPVDLFDAPSAVAEDFRSAFRRGRHVVLRIPRGRVVSSSLRSLIGDCRPALTVVSGGDTLSLVCNALEIQAIEMRRELAPGIPAGIIRGGAWTGGLIATKSGGFGRPDDLLRVLDWLRPESAPSGASARKEMQ